MRYEVGDIIKNISYNAQGFKKGDIYYVMSTSQSESFYIGKLLSRDYDKYCTGDNNWMLRENLVEDGDFELKGNIPIYESPNINL